MSEALAELDAEHPTGLRHLLDFMPRDAAPLPLESVDITIGRHAMPPIISAMSFGSQGENSFRAYAEAARKEKYVGETRRRRSLRTCQRSHGKPGTAGGLGPIRVSMSLLNSARYLEIKVGQGPNPARGRASARAQGRCGMVAQARHCAWHCPHLTVQPP